MRSPRFVGLFVVGASVVLASVASAQIRIRTNPDPVNCQTGDINLAGTPVPATSTCKTGTVVAVGGVANGDITP